jgi:putative NADH-flavin reductase
MRLLILGASGGTGRLVVSQALERGDDVTAFVRKPGTLPAHGRMREVIGSLPADRDALAQAARGQDAVISSLGVGKSFNPNGLIASSVPVIVEAMRSANVRRIVFTSAFGVGPMWQYAPIVPRIFFRTLLRRIYKDKAAGDAQIVASGLDWTLVHPTLLKDGPRTGTYRVGESLALRGSPTVARADVADCLLKLVNDRATIGKRLLISSS